MLPVKTLPAALAVAARPAGLDPFGGGELTMSEATQAAIDPVWPVLAVAAAILITIVIGLVRSDRLASRRPVQANNPAAPNEFGGDPGKAPPANRRTSPPR